ncbi:hypothetical protein LTR66_008713 [Elasticomyces elasticus]|nr:hypothetical protein LTR66_008713 [Elasticomyces elasticus]
MADTWESSFRTTRINPTTFLIVEDDKYAEHPFIYVKVHPTEPVLLLSDTGCNAPRVEERSGSTAMFIRTTELLVTLRRYLEYVPVAANNDKPLNPGPNFRSYVIICTHCHYDHIGGIEQFVKNNREPTMIVASLNGRSFIEDDLPKHSLCKYLNIPTPGYHVSVWAGDLAKLDWKPSGAGRPSTRRELGIIILNTPGHTPDELAWYDVSERHLYVGDTFYEEGEDGMAIIFPKEGDWIDFMASLTKMLRFVQINNGDHEPLMQSLSNDNETLFTDANHIVELTGDNTPQQNDNGWVILPPRVKVGCGHQTSSVDGEEIIKAVQALFWNIIKGKVPVSRSEEIRGEVHDIWREEGDDVRFSVRAPRRLCEEARKELCL